MCYQHLIEIPLNPTQNKSINKSITYSNKELREIRNKVKDNKLYLRLNQGTIRKVRDCRINRQRITPTRHEHKSRGVNTQNLIAVRTIDFRGKVTTPYLKIATLNARSIKNKDQLFFSYGSFSSCLSYCKLNISL